MTLPELPFHLKPYSGDDPLASILDKELAIAEFALQQMSPELRETYEKGTEEMYLLLEAFERQNGQALTDEQQDQFFDDFNAAHPEYLEALNQVSELSAPYDRWIHKS